MRRWNRSIASFLGTGVLALAVTSAQAQPVNTYPGYRNNAMTKKEAKKLTKRREHLDRVRGRALRDGYVTRKEAKKINKAEQQLADYRARATDDYTSRGYPWNSDFWRNWWNGDRFDNRRDDRYDQGRWNGNRGRNRWYAEGDQQRWYNSHNHPRQHDDQDRQRQHDHHDHRGWNSMHERQR